MGGGSPVGRHGRAVTNGGMETDHVYDENGNHVLAQADANGVVNYLMRDGHGSTRALIDSAGTVTQTLDYDAFGGAIGFDPATVGTEFLFAGDAIYDAPSGLDDFNRDQGRTCGIYFQRGNGCGYQCGDQLCT